MASTFKTLAQSAPTAANLTDAYTVPGATTAIINVITVCNRSATPTTYRLSIAVAGAADATKQYLAFDAAIGANEIWEFSGRSLAATDVIRVYATLATVSFNINGEEIT